jgi:membrane protease YdiL (CAAX protease family)
VQVLAALGAAITVLLLTRTAPDFPALGPRYALFGWLFYVTAVTAGVPLVVTRLGSRLSLSDCGLGWGRTWRDAPWLVVGIGCAVVAGAMMARSPEVRAYYPRYALVKTEPLLWVPSTLAFAAYGLSWETLFRGHLLLALAPRSELGIGTVGLLALQTAVFATGHLDKPSSEVALSVPAGLFLGLVALRTRSVLPGFLLHFAASTSVNLFCAYG